MGSTAKGLQHDFSEGGMDECLFGKKESAPLAHWQETASEETVS